MKSIVKYSLAAVAVIALFTGCGCKEPEIKIVKEKELVIVEPDAVNYTYVSTPNFPDQIENMEIDEALDMTIEYSIKLQTVIQQYEARVDSLKKYIEDVKAKQLELDKTKQ